VDYFKNTPLGLALQCQHFTYSINLIQKNASVLPLAYFEDPDEMVRKWRQDEEKKIDTDIKEVKKVIAERAEEKKRIKEEKEAKLKA
jgi:hypothetical protein